MKRYKRINAIFLLLLSLILVGCKVNVPQPIAAVLFGIKKPAKISDKKLERKKKKYELSIFPHLNVTEEGFWDYYRTKQQISNKFCDLFVFRKNQLILPLTDELGYCNLQCKFITSLPHSSKGYKVVDTVLLTDFINQRNIVEYTNESQPDTSEFVFLFYWGNYAGVVNNYIKKPDAQQVVKKLIDSGFNASAYYINLDVKENWTVDKLYFNAQRDSVNSALFTKNKIKK